jgi:hypothetical protein
MMETKPEKKGRGTLLKILSAHYNALIAAGGDNAVLKQYAALLRFLKSEKGRFLDDPDEAVQRTGAGPRLTGLNEEDLRRASLDDVVKLVNDDATPRKDLEYIAIERFSVPRGSMRSFSNRRMLIDKLLTLIDNERTHETIGAVARGQTK